MSAPALASAHPSLRALALDVEAALATLSQRLDTRLDLLEARTLGGGGSTSTERTDSADSRSSPRPINRRTNPNPNLPYSHVPDTPPLSAPLREEPLLHHLHHHHLHGHDGDYEEEEAQQRRRMAEVLTPGSSVNEGAGAGVGGGHREGEDEAEGEDKSMPIAIVGMGCRFPQEATSPEKLWEMLYNKRHARTEVPKERFNAEAFYHPDADRNGSMNLKGGHYLKEDIATFDARFFSISPAEAKSMDPMQRILLEVVYEAMENAGITLADLDGSDTGCYVGCFTDDYDGLLKRDMELSPKYHSVGIVPAILSNRISFCFNLKGPSLTVDTACSSSLVAVHLACQSLRAGESRVAIVGATNALINPEIHVGMSNMHFLSPDSTCFTFDERANGYARGEGMAALILKPLDDALRDGDTIRAVIRGTAANQDGRTAGMTLPSMEAQTELIQRAYEDAGCDPAATGYFEAHGTGTAAGDPIEASAIGATLGRFRGEGEEGKLFVGSVKTNIGHLEGASGLAGLIKAVLSLERGVVLPNLWFENGNPAIDFEGWRIRVPTEPTAWPSEGLRRASINSFGFGGTNCHAIVDDALHYLQSRGLKGNHCTSARPLMGDGTQRSALLGKVMEEDETLRVPTLTSTTLARPRIFKISANEEKLALTLAKSFAEHLATVPTGDDGTETTYLDNLAYTLHTRRTTLPWTVAVVASSLSSLSSKLHSPTLRPVRRAADTPKLGFIFTGQGAQWAGMGRELLAYPVFKDVVLKADDILRDLGAPWSLLEELCKEDEESRVHEAALSQPMCTALQIALADLLSAWGVHPTRVVGHSSGEIAAAYTIGALSLRGALQVAYFRGVHSARVSALGLRGGMMAVGLAEEAARGYVEGVDPALGRVVVACINSPRSVTVSGDEGAVEALRRTLDGEGVFARRLVVDTAYHSQHMHSIASAYHASLSDLAVTPPGQRWPIEMISSVTARSAADEPLDADYWVRNMVSPVHFSSALAHMCAPETKKKRGQRRPRGGAVSILVEVGPHAALAGPVKQVLLAGEGLKKAGIRYLSALTRGRDGADSMMAVAASLSASGHGVDVHTANFPHPLPPSQHLATLPDLPSYAWNHSTRYWSESRLSLDYRMRPFPRTDVLGAQSTDWNPTEPVWRNFVRLAELPWLKHHQVQDTVIYPAAGYVCMALEAAAQVLSVTALPPGRVVRGFTVRDLAISRALVVPTTEEGVETVFSMRPLPDSKMGSSAAWREFRVFSFGEGGWAEHCRGVVGVDFAPAPTPAVAIDGGDATTPDGTASPAPSANTPEVVGADEFKESERAARAEMDKAERVCARKGDVGGMYDALASGGLWYGPSFRVITSVSTGGGMALGRVAVPDTKSMMPMEFEYPSLVHPATLDGFIQMIIPALSQGEMGSAVHEPFVPTFIEELSFSSVIASQAGYEFDACAKAGFKGVREAVAGITVFDPLTREAVVRIRGMKCMAISGGGPTDVVRKHCGTAVWEPDVDLLGDLQMLRVLRGAAVRAASPAVAGREDVEVVAWWFADCALRDVKPVEVSPQRRGLYEFLLEQRDAVRAGRAEYQTPLWEALEDFSTQEQVHNLIADFSASGDAEARLLVRMGMALPGIIRGDLDPDEVRRGGGRENEYFATALGVPHTYAAMQRYLTMLAHKYPDLEYLELGAGRGETTRHALDALDGCAKYRYPKVKAYTYSDPCDATFKDAAKRWEKWGSLFETRVLDIAGDIGAQGFGGRLFDVIIAANTLGDVVGDTVDLALANVRTLLKPGGKLILLEATHLHLSASLILTRPAQPWQEHQWEDALARHGFGGLEASAPDVLDARAHVTSVMVASVLKPQSIVAGLPLPLSLHVILVAPSGGGSAAAELLDSTCSALGGHGIGVEIVTFSGLARTELQGKIVICLAELDVSVLADVMPADFAQLQRLTREPVGLLWITRGSIAGRSTKPELSIFPGLARSLRAEQEGFPCVTVDLDADYRLPADQVVDLLFGVFRQTFVRGQAAGINDREFAERNGILHVKRMVEDDAFNKYIATRTGAASLKPRAEKLAQRDRPFKLAIDGVGSLDSFYFSDDTGVGRTVPMAKGEVEISVQAVGLNFRDILIAMGEMSDNYLGNECAGVVTQVGEGVTHVSVGDRVAVWCLGCFATLMRNPADTVMKIPEDMDFVTAAGFPIIYVTAYYSLVHLARLQAGESVLIHAAAGGVGQAAIQIAQRLGAEVYVTVGTGEKKAHIMELFGIPSERIFSSRDVSFEAGIKRVTDGRGVDVVLNSLAGESLRASWRCVAAFGRFVELGKRDIEAGGRLDMGVFARNVVFASVDITAMLRLNRRLGASVFREAMAMGMEIRHELLGMGVEGGASPVRTFGFGEVGEAFRHMQAGRHVGKIVVVPRQGDVVQVMPKPLKGAKFHADASYLLAGGLGGIGRSLSMWMAANGARNLIFVSRSGVSNDAARELVGTLLAKGVRVEVIKCDIADEVKLFDSLNSVLRTMPPIRGVIQGAMVLRDQIFANMPYETFVSALRPKVQGSWSLHQATLDQPLDFFVLLSSASSFLGNAGQGNYVAACTYQVALAAHRLSLGLPATAIDIGKVASVGVVAESANSAMEANLVRIGLRDIQEAELHAIIELAMLPNAVGVTNGHLITGAHTSLDPGADAADLPFWSRDPVFSHLDALRPHLACAADGGGGGSSAGRASLKSLLGSAPSRSAAVVAVLDALLAKLARALAMPVVEIDASRSTAAYGIDSLLAVDIRNWIFREAGADVAVFEVLQAGSVGALAGRVVEGSSFLGSVAAAGAAGGDE